MNALTIMAETAFLLNISVVEDFILLLPHIYSNLSCDLPIFDPNFEQLVGNLNLQMTFELPDMSPPSRKRPLENNFGQVFADNHGKQKRSSFFESFENSELVQEAEVVNSFQESNSAGGKKLFLCEICPFRSHMRSAVKRHVFVKHSQNCPRFQCTMCDSVIKQKGNLKTHYLKRHMLTDKVATAAVADSQCVY